MLQRINCKYAFDVISEKNMRRLEGKWWKKLTGKSGKLSSKMSGKRMENRGNNLNAR